MQGLVHLESFWRTFDSASTKGSDDLRLDHPFLEADLNHYLVLPPERKVPLTLSAGARFANYVTPPHNCDILTLLHSKANS